VAPSQFRSEAAEALLALAVLAERADEVITPHLQAALKPGACSSRTSHFWQRATRSETLAPMTADQVLEVLDWLETAGVQVWVGGWASTAATVRPRQPFLAEEVLSTPPRK
jgi:hypothetical protein